MYIHAVSAQLYCATSDSGIAWYRDACQILTRAIQVDNNELSVFSGLNSESNTKAVMHNEEALSGFEDCFGEGR